MPTRRLTFSLVLCLLFAPPGRTQGLAPDAIVERHGNVTNITMPGQLAPTRTMTCIDVPAVQTDDTPPDLYTGIRRCVVDGQFERAFRLVVIAGLEASFDARRMTDVSARDAGPVLASQLNRSMTDAQRAQMQAVSKTFLADPQALPALCRTVAGLPPPTYVPAYMILHGLNALTGAKDDPLVTPFDAAATWTTVQQEYLHCP